MSTPRRSNSCLRRLQVDHERLEGDHRPGHFAGVATIVQRLFAVVDPHQAYFGWKDFQQCLVVRDLARQQGGPRVVFCPTERDASGLALSSRNALLTTEWRSEALAVPQALVAAQEAWDHGERNPEGLRAALRNVLERSRLAVEYATVRDPEHWTAHEPTAPLPRAVALVAARAGEVRLIDNRWLSGEPAV